MPLSPQLTRVSLFFCTFLSKINSFVPCPKTIYGFCWCSMFCTALCQALQTEEHRKDRHQNPPVHLANLRERHEYQKLNKKMKYGFTDKSVRQMPKKTLHFLENIRFTWPRYHGLVNWSHFLLRIQRNILGLAISLSLLATHACWLNELHAPFRFYQATKKERLDEIEFVSLPQGCPQISCQVPVSPAVLENWRGNLLFLQYNVSKELYICVYTWDIFPEKGTGSFYWRTGLTQSSVSAQISILFTEKPLASKYWKFSRYAAFFFVLVVGLFRFSFLYSWNSAWKKISMQHLYTAVTIFSLIWWMLQRLTSQRHSTRCLENRTSLEGSSC